MNASYWNPNGVFLTYDYQSQSLTALTDVQYQFCVRLQVGLNTWDGTYRGIQQFISANFPGQITCIDNENMTLTYNVSRLIAIDPAIIVNFLPRPMGVAAIVNIV